MSKKTISTKEIENKISAGASAEFVKELEGDAEQAYEYIKRIMEEKDIKAADIVGQCSGEKSYVYQMISGKRKPTRKYLISVGLIAGISADEMQRLLKIGGRAPLYVKKRYDAAIYFAIENSLGIKETNELLYELGEELL